MDEKLFEYLYVTGDVDELLDLKDEDDNNLEEDEEELDDEQSRSR